MKYRRDICIVMLVLMPVLAGCHAMGMKPQSGEQPSKVARASDLAGCDSDNAASAQLDVALVRKLMDEERYHAAMAQIDALHQETSYTRYIRARILHKLALPDAEDRYRELLGSCMDGYARHGLGLLAAEAGDLGRAADYLQSARIRLPLDPVVRNDYGYALLLNGDPEAAYFEFITALELESAAVQPRYNALLALLILDRPQQAQHFAERMSIPEQTFERARREAASLRARHATVMSDWQGQTGPGTAVSPGQGNTGSDDPVMLQPETGMTPMEYSR